MIPLILFPKQTMYCTECGTEMKNNSFSFLKKGYCHKKNQQVVTCSIICALEFENKEKGMDLLKNLYNPLTTE